MKDNLSLTIEHCLHGTEMGLHIFFTINMKNIESTPSVQAHSMFSSRMPLFKHKENRCAIYNPEFKSNNA